ncbi:hypothetical protein CERSUDRAFT_125630 [Gelatoporia subvermispora B]|uniref:CCHC-type domain-containing protein n=1 Tax=Ceriporiopsis subvermispora (strain B) TaxID=914234 RepID=M2PF52_CERS8|nr:hypothetical protein CERSUDRAFT_125630 [Gelatoporia subvermispora B]
MFTRSMARNLVPPSEEPKTPSVPGSDETLDSVAGYPSGEARPNLFTTGRRTAPPGGPAASLRPPPATRTEENSRDDDAEEEIIRSVLISEIQSERSDTDTSAVLEAGRTWLSHHKTDDSRPREPTGCAEDHWKAPTEHPPQVNKVDGGERITVDPTPRPQDEPGISGIAPGDQEAGPSSLEKGKTVDPRNWGSLDMDPEELDPRVQQRELDAYAKGGQYESLAVPSGNKRLSEPPIDGDRSEVESLRAEIETLKRMLAKVVTLEASRPPRDSTGLAGHKIEEDRGTTRRSEREKKLFTGIENASVRGAADNVVEAVLKPASLKSTRPRFSSLQPIAQVEPEGFLGRAFSDLKPKRTRGSRRSASRDTEGSDSSGGKQSESSNGYSSDSEVEVKGSSGRSAAKRDDKRPRLKPREPETYSGQADIEKFYKFMEQSKEYLAGYRLSKKRYAGALSHFLAGKAYSFYTLVVSGNPSEWSIHALFVGLFNYCFPADFRDRMRDKLDGFSQGNLSVREYSHELQRMFRVVDDFTKTQKVRKLWRGFKGYIVEGLISKEMSPTIDSWKAVLHAAEVLEEAARAKERANKRAEKVHAPSAKPNDAKDHRPKQRGDTRPGPDKREVPGTSRDSRGSNKSAPKARDGDRGDRAKHDQSKLSAAEKAQLAADGKCYLCKEIGHFARNCPRAAKVKTNRRDRAPGIYSSNIEFGSNDTEELRVLASRTISTTDLELNAIELVSGRQCVSVQDVTDDESGPPRSRQVSSSSSGSDDEMPPLALVSDSSEDGWGFDSDFSEDSDWEQEKLDSRVSEDLAFEHPDKGAALEDTVTLPRRVRCPLKIPLSTREGRRRYQIGDVYAARARELLLYHVAPLSTEPDKWSCVFYPIDPCRGQYVMMGGDLQEDVVLEGNWLRDPDFDVLAWYRSLVEPEIRMDYCYLGDTPGRMGDAAALAAEKALNREEPAPVGWVSAGGSLQRFVCRSGDLAICIWDSYLCLYSEVPSHLLEEPRFDLPNYYARMAWRRFGPGPWLLEDLDGELDALFGSCIEIRLCEGIELSAIRVAAAVETYPALQRNAATPRDFKRSVPEPVVVVVQINGEPARTLLDSGSLADFMSAKLAHQLGVTTFELAKPLPVHLAVQGSRAKISLGSTAGVEYQGIRESRYFDVVNLLNYDLILGVAGFKPHEGDSRIRGGLTYTGEECESARVKGSGFVWGALG